MLPLLQVLLACLIVAVTPVYRAVVYIYPRRRRLAAAARHWLLLSFLDNGAPVELQCPHGDHTAVQETAQLLLADGSSLVRTALAPFGIACAALYWHFPTPTTDVFAAIIAVYVFALFPRLDTLLRPLHGVPGRVGAAFWSEAARRWGPAFREAYRLSQQYPGRTVALVAVIWHHQWMGSWLRTFAAVGPMLEALAEVLYSVMRWPECELVRALPDHVRDVALGRYFRPDGFHSRY